MDARRVLIRPRAASGPRLDATCTLACACAVLAAAWASAEVSPYGWALEDPKKFVDEKDSNWCEQCHPNEFEVWRETSHFKGFREMRGRDRAREIADRLGIVSVTRDSRCLTCHFTVKQRGSKQTASSGVSCQSCHGAARDWAPIHHDHGEGADHESEPRAHRQQRVAAARKAGMRRPSDFYPSGTSCYRCHVVPDEKLVNVGGHVPGTPNFELVSRTQQKIRHNFLRSRLREEEPSNATRPKAYQRRMFVMGRALELEYGLRGLAVATGPGVYLDKMVGRVEDAMDSLDELTSVVPIPELSEILELARALELVPNRRRALEQAAASISRANQTLVRKHDGERWAAIDALVEGRGLEIEDEPEQAAGEVAGRGGSEGAAAGRASAGASPARPSLPARKQTLRQVANRSFLGPGECAGCHDDSWAWYKTHPHAKSIDPFKSKSPDVLRIARNYGINEDAIRKGSSVCMDCHSTVAKGRERRDQRKGVDCQACHGAANQYLELHKKEKGARGYQVGLQNGMIDVRKLPTTAQNCTSCHYVTDQRLLAAGHGSGKDFDWVKGMASVRHWKRSLPAAGEIQRAFTAQIAKRGGVPKVTAITAVSIPQARVATTGGIARRSRSGASAAPTARPARDVAPSPDLDLDLPAFPDLPEDAPVEQQLRLIQERLERLREQLGAAAGAGTGARR